MISLLPFSLKSKLILWLMVVASTAHAQFRLFKGIDEIEITGGVSSVSFMNELYDEYTENKLGHRVGIGAGWEMNDKFSFCSGVFLERKGIDRHYTAKYYDVQVEDFRMGEVDENTNLDYVTVVLAVKFSLTKERNLFIESGPYSSYLFKAQSITQLSWQGKMAYDAKDYYKKFDFGFYLRVGYAIPSDRTWNLMIWSSYCHGLVDVTKEDSTTTAFHDVKNQALSVGLSFCFK